MNKLNLILLVSFSLLLLDIQAQEETSVEKNIRLQLDVGAMILFNNLNHNDFYEFKYPGYSNKQALVGINLKFTVPSKMPAVDIIFGTMFLAGKDDANGGFSPGNANSSDHTQNGGGVYAGISPKLKGKVIGLTSDFAIGIFSFKEYVGIFNNTQPPYIDTYDRMASHGLGAMSSIGFYVKMGAFGINPTLNAVYSGGPQTSFLFYGFNFPLTIRLSK